nr:hypothetical protein [Tanacetum cinerariifolium]
MEKVPTEMKLILEHTQQGISHEVSVTPTKPGRMTKPYSSHRFIDDCFNAGNLKMEVKVPGSSCLIDLQPHAHAQKSSIKTS